MSLIRIIVPAHGTTPRAATLICPRPLCPSNVCSWTMRFLDDVSLHDPSLSGGGVWGYRDRSGRDCTRGRRSGMLNWCGSRVELGELWSLGFSGWPAGRRSPREIVKVSASSCCDFPRFSFCLGSGHIGPGRFVQGTYYPWRLCKEKHSGIHRHGICTAKTMEGTQRRGT